MTGTINLRRIQAEEQIPGLVQNFLHETSTQENSVLLEVQELLLTCFIYYLYMSAPYDEQDMIMVYWLLQEPIDDITLLFHSELTIKTSPQAVSLWGQYRALGLNHNDITELLNSRISADMLSAVSLCAEAYNHAKASCYTKALRYLKDPFIYVSRADAYTKSKMFEAAIDDLNSALKFLSDEEKPWVFEKLGHIYHEMQLYNNAVSNFSKAIELWGNTDRLYNDRAKSYRELLKSGRS